MSRPEPLAQGERGQILILTALMLTVLLGITGLAIDVGYFFDYRQQMGAAADAAAKAGAFEVGRNGTITQTQLERFARNGSMQNRFTHGVDGIMVTVNHPPTSGPFSGNALFVEAIVEQQVPTFFARVLGKNTVNVGARAVAGLTSLPGCMVVLDPTFSNSYSANGSAHVTLPSCSVIVNSNASSYALSSTNSATLSATAVSVGGASPGYNTSAGGMVTVTQAPYTVSLGAPAQADPLAYLIAPIPDTCAAHPSLETYGSGSRTISEGTYCGGMKVNGGGTTTMSAGLYIINGGQLSVANGSTLNGTGVTIYNTGGATAINFSSGAIVNLSAPTTGSLAGVLLFQNRTLTQNFVIANATPIRLNGALYFPASTVSFTGGTFSSIYTFLIAKRVSFSGGAAVTLNNDTSTLPGGSPLKTTGMSE